MLIRVQFSESKVGINAKFNSSTVSIDTAFADLQKVTVREDVIPYMGEYNITPKVEAQTIPTAQKFMTDDVQIKAIPYFETSNNYDGETVYIGSEV